MTTYDLMAELEPRPRSTFLNESDKSANWAQESGTTLVRRQARNSPTPGVQQGEIAYAATVPNANGYSRLFTRRLFGPDLDVYGWFRVFRWNDDATANHGVKLYTGFEDNNVNNTISLLRRNLHPSWYLEDRVGTYAPDTPHGGRNQAVSSLPVDPTLHVRHRFLWRQRVVGGGLHGQLFIDGQKHIDHVSYSPVYFGAVGWRLDRTGVDWSLGVREVTA